MAELPVQTAAPAFVIATNRFPARAAYTTFLVDEFAAMGLPSRVRVAQLGNAGGISRGEYNVHGSSVEARESATGAKFEIAPKRNFQNRGRFADHSFQRSF